MSRPKAPNNQHPTRQRPVTIGAAVGMAWSISMALAFPPVGLWFASLLALMPLCWLSMSGPRPARTAVGFAFGTIPFWTLQHWWFLEVTVAGFPAFLALQGAIICVGCWLILSATRPLPAWARPIAVAVGWVGYEWLRGEIIFQGYAWFFVGHPMIDAPWLAALAELGGVGLVSLVVALVGALVVLTIVGPRRGLASASLLIIAGGALFTGASLDAKARSAIEGASTTTVLTLQTNIPQSRRHAGAWTPEKRSEDLIAFLRASVEATMDLRALGVEPELIVWPETMFPGYMGLDEAPNLALARAGFVAANEFREVTLDTQSDIGVPMLLGSVSYEGLTAHRQDGELIIEQDAVHNSMSLIDGGAVVTRYDKVKLAPFGEVMPYISNLPWLERLLLSLGASGMTFDLSPGTDLTRFTVETTQGPLRIATPICFEATIAPHCRSLVFQDGKRQSDLMINPTNDAWFGVWDAGRQNHADLARWRAIELRTPMIRSANTGISMNINALGEITATLPNPAHAEGVLVCEVTPAKPSMTLYGRIGNLVGALCAVVLGLLAALRLVRPQSPPRTPQEPSCPAPPSTSP